MTRALTWNRCVGKSLPVLPDPCDHVPCRLACRPLFQVFTRELLLGFFWPALLGRGIPRQHRSAFVSLNWTDTEARETTDRRTGTIRPMSDEHPWLATLTYASGTHEQRRFPTRAEAETYVLAAHKRGDEVVGHSILHSPEAPAAE